MPSGEEPLAAIAAVLSIDALIVGATGGVGSLAVQLAARASATSSLRHSARTTTTSGNSASASCCPATAISPGPHASAFDGFDAVLDLTTHTRGKLAIRMT